MLCVFFLLYDDLLCQSFLLLFSMNFSNHSCVFQIVHDNNLFQLFFVLINSCFCIYIFFLGVGDIFFSLYNLHLILISLINSLVIHWFLFLHLIFDIYPALSNWMISNVFEKALCSVGYGSFWLYILFVHSEVHYFSL